MRVIILILMLACLALGQEPERAIHHRLVQRYLPDSSLEEALWPVARDSGLLGRVPEDSLLLRRLYLGAFYGSPAGREWAGAPAEAPLTDAEVAAPELPLVLRLKGDRVEHVDGEIDFAIVGSGPAGCVAARVLNQRGFRVVVIERGSLTVPGSVDGRRVPALRRGSFTREGSVFVQRGQVVGGGALVNVDLAFAPVRQRFERWGLGELDLEGGYDWVRTHLGTRELELDEVNANNRVLWDGARALGLEPALYSLNTWAPATSPFRVTDKRSPVESLLLPALKGRAGLLADTEVVSLEGTELWLEPRTPWKGAWRQGLQLPGRCRLRARKVVLCAGAIGTAALLQRSGIACGTGVVLHPSVPVVGLYDRRIANWEGTPASVHVPCGETVLEAMSAGPEYVANMLWTDRVHELMRSYDHMAGFGVMLVDEPVATNRVLPDESVEYLLSEEDRARLAAGVEQAIRVHFAAGAREVFVPTREMPGVLRSESQASLARSLRFEPGQTLVSSSHVQGTCKIGQVVDRHGAVLGHPGLYVLDSSLFPESVGVNPMQTIYTMAYLLARELR